MDAFGFMDADLQANREGRLTARQLEALHKRARQQLGFGAIIGALGLFLLAFLFPVSQGLFLITVVALIFLAALYSVYAQYREFQTDIRAGTADHVAGKPYLHSAPSRGGTSYWLSVNGKIFYLHQDKYVALDTYVRSVNPATLTIYFTPKANVLLSIEEKE